MTISAAQARNISKFYQVHGIATAYQPKLATILEKLEQFNTITASDLHLLTFEELALIKSRINGKVEQANKHNYSIAVRGLKSKLNEYKNESTCNHFMQSCYPTFHPEFEILTHFKAAESSTKDHENKEPSFEFEVL